MATFCLLHGAWHDPSCWEPVRERLEALGHRTIAPELPLHDPAAGYEERVRPAIEALAEADGPVVVVAHSQSSALGPLVAVARPVSLLVYLGPGWVGRSRRRGRRKRSGRASRSPRTVRTARRRGTPMSPSR